MLLKPGEVGWSDTNEPWLAYTVVFAFEPFSFLHEKVIQI